MFHNSSIFCMEDKETYGVQKLRINRHLQNDLTKVFSLACTSLIDDEKEYLKFDGRYTSGGNEIQYIDNFHMPASITNAIKEPLSANDLLHKQVREPTINAVFTGEAGEGDDSIIAFQNFQRNQIITGQGISIFLDKNTFKKMDSIALNIKNEVDCVYKNNKLYFASFWVARQVFDLSDYYNLATDADLEQFVNRKELYLPDPSAFHKHCDSWVRRKIALIQDAKTLDNYQPNEIVEKASEHHVDLTLKDNKIVVPEEKSELKTMLKFLDEDIYKGPLSEDTYETNSKRQFI